MRKAPAALVFLAILTTHAQVGDPAQPQESGLVEEAQRRLAQLDVTVIGPAKAIRSLTRADFELSVGGRTFEEFFVDAACGPPAAVDPPSSLTAETVEAHPAAAHIQRPPTYLFYFDQHHMSQEGRQVSLDTARELIPRLLQDGERASIVSAGLTLETFAETTDDIPTLLAALDRLESDRDQWDEFAFLEDGRVAEVLRRLRSGDSSSAMSLATHHAREESWRTDKALRLFSTVLSRLIDVTPPKAALYFADTMRRNPGKHYFGFFGRDMEEGTAAVNTIQANADLGAHPFDRVVEEAAGYGIRIYTVQARGLTNPTTIAAENLNVRGISGIRREPSTGGEDPTAITAPDSGLFKRPTSGPAKRQTAAEVSDAVKGMVRTNQDVEIDHVAHTRALRDAQNSLVSLAAETGGESFLNGVRPARIANRIREDMACVYLLSFDPGRLPENEPLSVLVRVTRPRVQSRTRGQMVLASETRRRTSRLLSAFASGNTSETRDERVEGIVIPTGFANGKYSALVQISVPPSQLQPTEWNVGASLVTRGRVADDAAGRIKITGVGIPVILEAPMTFAPGPFELIMVAHDTATDEIITGQVESEWPDPDASRASLGPLVVMQPAAGAFLRDGQLRTRGALAKARIVSTDADLALIGIVCRGNPRKTHFQVDRRIAGETAAEFSPLDLEPSKDRCAQFRDLIPARTLTEGSFSYEVSVHDGDEQLTSSQLDFVALAPGTEAQTSR